MTTIVTISVRESSDVFRGCIAYVAIAGDGSPNHFEAAVRQAMREAGLNMPTAQRITRPVSFQPRHAHGAVVLRDQAAPTTALT